MTIHETKNYHSFELLTGNRPVNKQKISKLKNEAKNGLNLFPYCPIIVYQQPETDVFKIIDGQHRFVASKEMQEPIYYVVCEKLTLAQIAKLNSSSTNWSSKNYLECYLKVGIEDYQDLKEIIERYRVAYAAAVDLLMVGNCKSKGNKLRNFKDGTFKSNHFIKTIELLDEVEEVFGRYEFWNHGYLIEAYRQLLEKGLFDKETLKGRIKQAPNIMEKRQSVKEYLFAIERVYNDKLQKRVTIY